MHVAIIGTGFSGVATACQLLQRLPASGRLTLFNASGTMARGLAYGTQSAAHVLNVPAGRMSLYPDKTGHFTEWARVRDPAIREHDFVSRRLYGDYLQHCLDQAIAARPDVRVETRVARVSRVEALAGGGHLIESSDGTRMSCQQVVLALGHFAPQAPHPNLLSCPAPRYVNDPWSPDALEALPSEASVALIGTGLTMLDVWLSLERRGHKGKVLALSRRGLLPLGHRDNELPPPAWQLSPQLLMGTARPTVWVREFRREVALAVQQGHDWRDVWGAFRTSTPGAWGRLGISERRQLLRHLLPYWEVHRHRAAPAAMAALGRAMGSGQLSPKAGRVCGVDPTGTQLALQWRPRGTSADHVFVADRVINCSGPGSRISASAAGLLWDLHLQGRLKICALGLGLEVGPRHEVLDQAGRPQQGLFYVGPLLKSQYWEATAVPELRIHAQQVAAACMALQDQ